MHVICCFSLLLFVCMDQLPWSQRIPFAIKRRDERERSGERKPLVAGDVNLTIML